MRVAAALAVLLMAGCSVGSSPGPATTTVRTSTPIAINTPPQGSELVDRGCGTTPIYKGGTLPEWATINAPSFLPYVIATPEIAMGYLFTYPLAAGLNANTKILWYVATPRGGYALEAVGHPLGAKGPTASFSKAADSGPGEIYPTGPTVPTAGCWHFTLKWQNGNRSAEVDLNFS
jgi:hypothetical protein